MSDTLQIRPAYSGDASRLTEITLESKAHWGYTAEFMEAVRVGLQVTVEQLEADTAFVLEADGVIVGYYKLHKVSAAQVELTDLLLDPVAMGRGWGRALWHHAVKTARSHGYAEMSWESDPHAEGFYLRMGARRVGEVESPAVEGRMLPYMVYIL